MTWQAETYEEIPNHLEVIEENFNLKQYKAHKQNLEFV